MGEDDSSRMSEFSGHERGRLARAMSKAKDVRLFRRIQAVLRVAEGFSVAEAARQVGVDRTSVHRWVRLYGRAHRIEDLADAPRTGRPREADDLDEELLAEVLAQDPRPLGYGATTWTVPLLATHLGEECGCPISERTLRRRLHEGHWRWKRPRYLFQEREPQVAQKKGPFAAA
jgi:transposase